jgi:hypothetical protein
VNVYLRLQLTCLLLSAICCCHLCLFRVLLNAFPFCFLQYTALRAFCNCHLFFFFNLQFSWRSAPSPASTGAFLTDSHSYKLSPLQVAGWLPPLLPSLAGLFIYSLPEGLPLPHSQELRAPCPLCYMYHFFFIPLLVYDSVWFFLFFSPGWGSVCLGGYADLAQGCLWEYHMPLSSPGGLHLPKQSGS